MSEDRFEQLFSAMSVEWNKAEKAIKLAENIDGEVVIPAIFELRYAGRRLVEAWAIRLSELESSLALLKDAKFDCHRARHDAIDAATSKMVGDMNVAVEFLSASVIIKLFPLFSEFYGSLLEVRERIAISREDRENRDKIYDTIQNVDLDRLAVLYRQFKSCEPLMVRGAEKEAIDAAELVRQAAASIRQGRIGLWVGIAGSIIGIVGLILAWKGLR